MHVRQKSPVAKAAGPFCFRIPPAPGLNGWEPPVNHCRVGVGRGFAGMAVPDRTLNILVLEDSLAQGRLIAGMLASLGCMVRMGASARELDDAIADAGALADVVLVDINLGGVNGLNLIDAIRERWPKAVVTVMTAVGMDDFKGLAEARARGADLVLPKPFGEVEARHMLADARSIMTIGRRRRHVVVIDDSPSVALLVAGFVEGRGMKATAFSKPEDVLQRLNYDHVDVVITDLVMPGMTGHEIIRLVRDVWPDVAIIAMSGASGPEAVQGELRRARELGASGVLSKPFNADQLATLVEQAVAAGGDSVMLDF